MRVSLKSEDERNSASRSSRDLNCTERSVRETLRTRGLVVLRVAGGSMGPWMRPGDFVVIHSRRLDEFNAGRIVVFTREGRLVIHRVLRLGTQGGERVLFTKGDAARHPDEPVHAEELIGEVISVDREYSSVDLGGQGRVIWSRLVSRVSPYSQYLYPGARLARRFLSCFVGQSRSNETP
jgi:signal peptidase I